MQQCRTQQLLKKCVQPKIQTKITVENIEKKLGNKKQAEKTK